MSSRRSSFGGSIEALLFQVNDVDDVFFFEKVNVFTQSKTGIDEYMSTRII